MNKLPELIQIFVRERKPKTSLEVAELANTYVDAHPREIKSTANNQATKVCFICSNKPGHIANECRFSHKPIVNNVSVVFCNFCKRRGHTEDFCFKRPFCPKCRCRGHLPNRCPKPEIRPISAGVTCVGKDDFVVTNSGEKIDLVSAFVKQRDEFQDFPSVKGTVNGKEAIVIRDTGCNTVLVQKRFVNPQQYTGDMGMFRVATLETRKAPFAKVYIESELFTGEVIALVVEHLLGDVLLGNIPQKSEEKQKEWEEIKRRVSHEKKDIRTAVNKVEREKNVIMRGIKAVSYTHLTLPTTPYV